MIRIGILTIHSAYNYGSALQALALKEALEELEDISAEIIDFQPMSIMRPYSIALRDNVNSVKGFVKFVLSKKTRKIKKETFDCFWKDNAALSRKTYKSGKDLLETNQLYDWFVVGSDQVWNPDIVREDFRAFCLNFADDTKFKITYASSFGALRISAAELAFLCESLKSFNMISVRENEAKSLLASVGKPISVVCDPVFLLSEDQWAGKMKKFDLPRQYILVYCVERDKEFIDKIREVGRQLHMPIFDVGTSTMKKGYAGTHSDKIGPAEFLYAIRNATYVITNSFHGTAFSVIFKKNFLVKSHSTRGVRMTNLLKYAHLSERKIDGQVSVGEIIRKLKEQDTIDFSYMDNYIKESKRFLLEAIDNGKIEYSE